MLALPAAANVATPGVVMLVNAVGVAPTRKLFGVLFSVMIVENGL